MEKVAEAETIVFDKTGTLTKAHPAVVEVVPFVQESTEELLGIAACLEEHFPHSMARAVVHAAQLAREIADITIDADHLSGLVTLKAISDGLMGRIRKNYFRIIGINSGLILLGVGGLVQPTTSALVHNASTLAISLGSMKNLLEVEKARVMMQK